MENLPTSFQCSHCDNQLILTLPSSDLVTGQCPVCANVITFEPETPQHTLSEIPQADLGPEIEAPILLTSPRKQFQRGKFAGSQRATKRWFQSETDTTVSPNGVPLVMKLRKKAAFAQPARLADRLERLSQGAD